MREGGRATARLPRLLAVSPEISNVVRPGLWVTEHVHKAGAQLLF